MGKPGDDLIFFQNWEISEQDWARTVEEVKDYLWTIQWASVGNVYRQSNRTLGLSWEILAKPGKSGQLLEDCEQDWVTQKKLGQY